jgi:hypothetical protein
VTVQLFKADDAKVEHEQRAEGRDNILGGSANLRGPVLALATAGCGHPRF